MTVRSTVHDHNVLVVTIDRVDRRNAVDRPTAAELAAAFREFDAEAELRVAVLTGAGAVFCAGADLKAFADGNGNRVDADVTEDAPMGVTRMMLSKPVIAAVDPGTALDAAVALAHELASLPQRCLRSDRLSAYEQWDLPVDLALARETHLGLATIRSGETQEGAARFAAGAGRHGQPG